MDLANFMIFLKGMGEKSRPKTWSRTANLSATNTIFSSPDPFFQLGNELSSSIFFSGILRLHKFKFLRFFWEPYDCSIF